MAKTILVTAGIFNGLVTFVHWAYLPRKHSVQVQYRFAAGEEKFQISIVENTMNL